MRWREESERRQDGSRALLSYQRQAGATADSGVVSDARKERKAKSWVGGRKCGKIGASQGTAGKQTWAKTCPPYYLALPKCIIIAFARRSGIGQ